MPDQDRDMSPTWADESRRDRRNTRWAVLAAVAIHVLFFRLQLPETVAAERRGPERPIFAVRTPRFEPPPPREQQQIPEPRALRIPVPDPTPDDPEPLAPAREAAAPIVLAHTDLVLGLPEAPPDPRPAGPMRVGGDVLPPVKRHAPPPRYTEIARAARIEGTVELEAVIDSTGAVTELRVIKALPLGLDQAAVDAVRRWRFEPATCNGRPVAVVYSLTIRFRLT